MEGETAIRIVRSRTGGLVAVAVVVTIAVVAGGCFGGSSATASGASPSAPAVASATAAVTATVEPTGTLASTPEPTQEPTVQPTDAATDEPPVDASPEPQLTLQPSPVAISDAAVTGRTRTGKTASGTVSYKFVEPTVATPGSAAGERIGAAIDAVIDAKLKQLDGWWKGQAKVSMSSSFVLTALTRSPSDAAGGFVSFQIDYVTEAPYADAGPQWVDVLCFDLRTGVRIAVTDPFTDAAALLQRLSHAAASDSALMRNTDYDPNFSPTGYEPIASNFPMWSPMPQGLRIMFANGQIGPAVAGHQYMVVPWDKVRDLVKPGSYLDWYLETLP